MTTPTPTPEAETVTFTRIPDPPRSVPRRGNRTAPPWVWFACGTGAMSLFVLALLGVLELMQPAPCPAPAPASVSAPMLDRALAEGTLIRGLKEGNGARTLIRAGDPLPAQVRVSGQDACKLAGGTALLQSDPPSCDVDVPTGFGGGR